MAGQGNKWQIPQQAQKAERSHLDPKAGSREHELLVGWGLKLKRPGPVTFFLQWGCTSQTSPNSITHRGPSLQMFKTRRDISHSDHHNPHLGKGNKNKNKPSVISFLNEVDPISNKTIEQKKPQITYSLTLNKLNVILLLGWRLPTSGAVVISANSFEVLTVSLAGC